MSRLCIRGLSVTPFVKLHESEGLLLLALIPLLRAIGCCRCRLFHFDSHVTTTKVLDGELQGRGQPLTCGEEAATVEATSTTTYASREKRQLYHGEATTRNTRARTEDTLLTLNASPDGGC